MMVERHYDDEALITLIEADRVRSDTHLPSCSACSEKLDTFRTISDVLHQHDVWDTAEVRRDPVPETIANLRAFADRMAFEDTAAEAILPELLAGSREEWMPRLMEHPEWRTAGVVRRLSRETDRAVDTMPPDAVEMSGLSTEIADHLEGLQADSAARLSGSAWRDRAYALFFVGRFGDALAAVDRADRDFQRCAVDEYDRARVAIVRSLILRASEELSSAMVAIRTSGDAFHRFNDLNRLVSAKLAESHLLFSLGDFKTASEILEGLERRMLTASADTHARVLANLGYCYWKLGRIDEALVHNNAAVALFDALGIQTESVRLRWSIASVLASVGRTDEASRRFEDLREGFNALGMTSEATLVSLDIAELMLTRQEFAAVEGICRAAIRSFEAAGIPYTARALTALAFMREAAHLRTATPRLARHVREYIRRLPEDGELLFAPPPV